MILAFVVANSHAENIQPSDSINLWSQDYLISQRSNPLPIEHQDKKGAISHVANPRMQVYVPIHSNHTAILVISGGGYYHEELAKEGAPVSAWLVNQGFTVFNLIYRLPNDNWSSRLVPIADDQRALRIMRQQAAHYHYHQIGVMGFSAGGHLAGMLAVSANHAFYPPQDDIDNNVARPDFAVLLYPVVSMVNQPNHTQAFKHLLGKQPTIAEEHALSIEQLVTNDTPPVFIAHAKDDPIAPVADSMVLDDKLKQAGVPQSLTLFETGGHGWGLGKKETPTMGWTSLFLKWVKQIHS